MDLIIWNQGLRQIDLGYVEMHYQIRHIQHQIGEINTRLGRSTPNLGNISTKVEIST